MKKIIAALIAGIYAFCALQAQNMSALLIPTDARTMSMAASTIALEPSGKLDAEAFFGKWAPKSANNMMAGLDAWFKVAEKFSLLIEGACFKDKAYDLTSAEGMVTGTFAPYEMLFALGGIFRTTDYISVELKAKLFMSTLSPDIKGNAFGADLLVRYHGNGFNIAAGACNLGTPIKYDGSKTSYSMPMLAKLGGSYSISGFTAAAELDYIFNGAMMAGLGLEYSIKDIAFVRAGYHYGDEAKALPSFASLGAGAQFRGVKLNFAYMLANRNIGGSLLVGVGYAF